MDMSVLFDHAMCDASLNAVYLIDAPTAVPLTPVSLTQGVAALSSTLPTLQYQPTMAPCPPPVRYTQDDMIAWYARRSQVTQLMSALADPSTSPKAMIPNTVFIDLPRLPAAVGQELQRSTECGNISTSSCATLAGPQRGQRRRPVPKPYARPVPTGTAPAPEAAHLQPKRPKPFSVRISRPGGRSQPVPTCDVSVDVLCSLRVQYGLAPGTIPAEDTIHNDRLLSQSATSPPSPVSDMPELLSNLTAPTSSVSSDVFPDLTSAPQNGRFEYVASVSVDAYCPAVPAQCEEQSFGEVDFSFVTEWDPEWDRAWDSAPPVTMSQAEIAVGQWPGWANNPGP